MASKAQPQKRYIRSSQSGFRRQALEDREHPKEDLPIAHPEEDPVAALHDVVSALFDDSTDST